LFPKVHITETPQLKSSRLWPWPWPRRQIRWLCM